MTTMLQKTGTGLNHLNMANIHFKRHTRNIHSNIIFKMQNLDINCLSELSLCQIIYAEDAKVCLLACRNAHSQSNKYDSDF